MYRFLFAGAVVVATVWALSCAAMVLIGVRAVSAGPSVRDQPPESVPLTDGLAPVTAVLLILSGTLLGVPLFAFAFWGIATLASGGP